MNKNRLKLVLENIREKYEKEWGSVEDIILKHLDEVRETIEHHFKNNQEIDFETTKKIYEKIETIDNLTKPFLLWISPSERGFARDKNMDTEKIKTKILNNQVIRDFLDEVRSLKSIGELQRIKDRLEKIRGTEEIKGIGISNLSSWMSIFNPKIFMPTWENTVNNYLRNDLGFNRFWGGDSDIEKFIEFTKTVREIADEVGINSMLEAAFYLSKYEGSNDESLSDLPKLLRKLKDYYHEEWKAVEKPFMDKIGQIRKLVLEKIEGGERFSEEDAEEILKLRNEVPEKCRFLLRFLGSAGEDPKEVLIRLLNNKNFQNLVKSIDYRKEDEIRKFYKLTIKEVTYVGNSSLSTWLAVLNPEYYMPTWGWEHQSGTLPLVLYKNIKELKSFENWWKQGPEKIFELFSLLKKVSNEVGINNMFETAFYLNKYESSAPPEIVEKIEQLTSTQKKPEIDEKIRKKMETLLTYKKQLILYGPPGTGKTWLARKYIESETGDNQEYYKFVTFHPSYSYEEFVEGLRPKADEEGNIRYEIEDGIYKKICKDAFNALMKHAGIDKVWENGLPELSDDEKKIVMDSLKDAPKFFLVIDEINRGDISRIFGELITLIEADKRLFAENELTVILPYSKKKFGVPPNLFIIGTMNTADRSIALIDVALRRRFGFIELMPDYEILEDKLLSRDDETRDIKELAIDVLKKLNERIRENYDRDHQIGHSYLLKLEKADTKDEAVETLQFIWYHEILPLLQEYFYDSPERLKRVLNNAFVRVEENSFDFEYLEGEKFVEELKKVAEQEQQ